VQSIEQTLDWLEQLPLAVAIARSNWAFPAIETIHVIALTLTIGTVLIIDLRLLGLASLKQPYGMLRRDVLPWSWAAFCMAAISGCLMFVSQAAEYFANQAFRIKLILLLLAGINMLIFELIIARGAVRWDRAIPWPGKIAALLSIILWVAAVFFGRRVGFTMLPGN
jgi:Family of unknown function (DUF6644)